MILPIKNKDNFIQNFLNPVSRLNPSATLDIHDTISTIVHNNSNIFLKAEYSVGWDDQPEKGTICLPDTIKINNKYKMLMIKIDLNNSQLMFVSTSYKN
jgi:hypothetical protein